MSDRLLTIQQLIEEHCPVSEDLIREWIKQGLPHHRASMRQGSRNPKILIRVSEFDAWLDCRRERQKQEKLNIHPRAQEIFEEIKRLGWE